MNVLITGASAGIGLATARQFNKLGAKLFLLARRPIDPTLGATTFQVDVTDTKAVAALDLPDIDILVNNAGMALGTEPAQAGDLAAWKRMVDVNINGVLNVTHHVLPKMVKRNAGHIINLGSIAATYPYVGGNVYGATKAFLQQFTKNLKADLIGTAVRVTNIEPGMVETEFSVVRFKGDDAKAKAVYAGMQPLVADDIAEMIVWAAMRPAHVNILSMEVMPVAQAFAGFSVNRS